jgi:hypothetical protein
VNTTTTSLISTATRTVACALSAVLASSILLASPVHANGMLLDGGGAPAASTPKFSRTPSVIRDNQESKQWHLEALRVRQADTVSTGTGTVVALLTDGVRGVHPDLADRIVPGFNALTGKAYDARGDLDDETGWFGTYAAALVAGTADGAGVRGIASDAKVMPIVVRNERIWAHDAVVAKAIDWAVANGASVIAMAEGGSYALSGDKTQATCIAIAAARAQGVLTFASAANDMDRYRPEYDPATCSQAVSVGGVSTYLSEPGGTAMNVTPAFVAPATRLVSATTFGQWFPYRRSESVVWAPVQAAAVAALVVSKNRNATAQDILNIMTSTATDLGPRGADNFSGAGMLDAAAAVGAASVRSEIELMAAIASVSVPTITRIERDDNLKQSALTWEPPAGVPVTGYTITGHSWNGTAWTKTTFPASANAVRLVVDFDVRVNAHFTITAHTASGERESIAAARSEDSTYIPVSDVEITSTTYRWTKAGLEVSIKVDDKSKAEDWTLYLQLVDSQDYTAHLTNPPVKIDVAKTKFTVVYKLGVSSPLRGNPIVAYAVMGYSVDKVVAMPQFSLSTHVRAAGKKHAAVAGTAAFSCYEDVKVACEGTMVTVVDAKTRKVLARTVILEDLSFSAVFPWKSDRVKVQLLIGGKPASVATDTRLSWRGQ